MPHCVVEYSNDLESKASFQILVQKIFNSMAETDLFNAENIKVRAVPVKTYLSGGNAVPFIHSTVRIFAGRSEQQKQNLSQNILDIISAEFVSVDYITVEVIDINPNCYAKKAKN